MDPRRIFKDREVLRRKQEEVAYHTALEEFQSGKLRPGLMAKSIAESNGDESKAKARYIQLAAASIIDDMYIAERANEPISGGPVLIRGLCSLLLPGLGQLLQGRIGAAIFHFLLAGLLWMFLLGWIVHICSAIGAASYGRNRHDISDVPAES